MKKILVSLVAIATIALTSFGQAPEGFKYQAVVRDAGNLILNNQDVGMRLTIQQGSPGGTAVYTETFGITTNTYGLVNLVIGAGTVVSGDFTTIDWSAGPFFIETAVDITGGITYVVMGTSQLMSVPYALYAKTSGNGAGPQGPAGNNGADGVTSAGTGISVTGAGTVGSPYVVSATSLSIGDTIQGGMIFYLDASGCHGLISATTDQSTGIQWYNGSSSYTNATFDGVKAGQSNTKLIIDTQVTGSYAAKLCDDLIIYSNTGLFEDWYLPSKYELNLMYDNIGQGDALGLGNVGQFANDAYCSSTEYSNLFAWGQDFFSNTQFPLGKNYFGYVRAVRAF